MSKHFIVFGRAGVDLYAEQEGTDLKKVSSFKRHVGGSAANIAVGLSRLGNQVGLLNKVSDDPFGDYITSYLAENKVTVLGKPVSYPYRNSLAITEMKNPSGVVFYRQHVSDLAIAPDETKDIFNKTKKIDAVVLTGTALSGSPSRESVLYLVKRAKEEGIPVILDLDYRPTGWANNYDPYIYYSLVIQDCSMVIGTVEEYQKILEFPEVNLDKEILISKFTDYFSKHFLSETTRLVILKDGENGSTAYEFSGKLPDKLLDKFSSELSSSEADNIPEVKITRSGIFPVKTKKNFGAGDGFAAGFVDAYFDGRPVDHALKQGAAVASIVVSQSTCTEAMPRRNELEQFIKENSIKENQ